MKKPLKFEPDTIKECDLIILLPKIPGAINVGDKDKREKIITLLKELKLLSEIDDGK